MSSPRPARFLWAIAALPLLVLAASASLPTRAHAAVHTVGADGVQDRGHHPPLQAGDGEDTRDDKTHPTAEAT